MKKINYGDIDLLVEDEIKDKVKIVVGNKSKTLNGMGYIFFTLSPLTHDFIENEAQQGKTVLEIGSGFGNIAYLCLERNVTSYTANDICEEHLQILVSRIKEYFGEDAEEKFRHLTLLHAKAPKEFEEVVEKYDAILIDKVIHFFKPEEVTLFVGWVKKALKKGGKLYLSATSPYSPQYCNMFPEYLERLSNGEQFPGYFTDVMARVDKEKLQNFPNYKVPDSMIFFSRNELISLFEKEGFSIEKSYSFKMPNREISEWLIVDDEFSNLSAVICVNN